MTQILNRGQQLEATKKLKHFVVQTSIHLKNSWNVFFNQLIHDIQVARLDDSQITTYHPILQKYTSGQVGIDANEVQYKQVSLPENLRIFDQENIQKSLGIGEMLSSMSIKQTESFKELLQNINQNQFQSPQSSKIKNLPDDIHKDIFPQMAQSNKEQLPMPKKQKQQISPHQQSQIKKQNSIQAASNFCQNLKQQFNHNVFNKDSILEFLFKLEQIFANNSYICVQQSFEELKADYVYVKKLQIKNRKSISNLKLNHVESQQFNLQLTFKSRQSKNSMSYQAGDSLIYSNATLFGLQSTQNRSKPLSRNDVSIKNLNQASLKLSNHPSLKYISRKDQHQTDIMHIERTQSRGEVEKQSRGEAENDRFSSANSLTDTERLYKFPPKSNRNNSSQQKKDNSSRQYLKLNSENEMNTPKKVQIKEEHDYEVIPLTQERNQDVAQFQTDKKELPPKDEEKNIIKNSQKRIRKSFSINNYTDKLKSSRKSTNQKPDEISVFSNEISNLQNRISRVKQVKLAKKLQLQQQLRKINNEIQNIKDQQHPIAQRSGDKQKSFAKSRQNTLQSRIKINDDIHEKKKAVNLIRNLRAEKISRENEKRNKIKVIDTDLHQEIEDIMRLKYFNQQRVKQKKKLEIIERMKQQEMRKIIQQKQKQQSSQFLSKLRQQNRETEPQYHREVINNKVTHRQQNASKKSFESPVKKMQHLELNEPASTPNLDKKKAYLNKMRNFAIVKRKGTDIYEHALN